jgi:class 3 adenylate cyclase
MSPAKPPVPARLILPDGQTFDLLDSLTIGRSQTNSVVIDNDFIGRKHALIQVQKNGECWLVDLGSSNGTYVKTHRVTRPLPLKDGDVIDMAGSLIEFHTPFDPDGSGITNPTLPRVEHRDCWLMIGDIVGFAKMAQNFPPGEIAWLTGSWFNACGELIKKRGGHMNQYLGDGFFCYWDDTPETKGQILDAMRELSGMQQNASPSFRVVLHFCGIALSTVPDTKALQLHGDEVNFAFRMEKVASRFKDIQLCSEAALEKLGVKSLVRRESEVGGYEGVFPFHVPDLR